MNKVEVYETVKDIRTQIQKMRMSTEENRDELYNLRRADEKLDDATIWLDKFAASFKTATEDKKDDKIIVLPDVTAVHNDKGKIAAKVNYLTSIIERLTRYGNKVNDFYPAQCILFAVNYIHESIVYFERAK